ncbi:MULTISPECIES: hypothetical protein [Moorena]|uniref:Uncharacterized protein n=1 Tax=Moorena producens 3L TaxID=489825 RepID=F4XZM2_9CYAN|nr:MULTISPECIES: hypothetical protein [Moorena]EGJ30027.1 hypothetical protein LYNGBM3L_57900 [Moorena producens 3L]
MDSISTAIFFGFNLMELGSAIAPRVANGQSDQIPIGATPMVGSA